MDRRAADIDVPDGPTTGAGEGGAQAADRSFATKLLHVIWLSILLGLAIEATLVLIARAFAHNSGAQPLIAEVVQKLSWSFLVCMGLAIGTTVAKSLPAAPGVVGLLATPLAFYVARALHRGAIQALGLVETSSDSIAPLLLAALRGVEYGCLGALIGWAVRRNRGTARTHLAIGFATGLIFGGAFVLLRSESAAARLALAGVLALGVNEVIFPTGCAFVLYAAGALEKRLAHVAS